MSFSDRIRVSTHYTRSINMERDVDSLSVVDAYIPTTRAIRTLDTMADAFGADEHPRAWSLVGPYGSGKSSFAVFLSHLLSDPSKPITRAASKKLQSADAGVSRKYKVLSESTSGYCSVLLTGSPEPLGKRLIDSLLRSSKEIWSNRRGRPPAVIEKLKLLAGEKEPPATSEILQSIVELQGSLTRLGYGGLLIVIDELGKFLEYEARHYGANDIYLLQALAEQALVPHTTKLSLVVMLHQAFEQYARGLGESLRSEWAKVQGRFENIPFLESAEQVLRVVGTAIEQNFTESERKRVAIAAHKVANVLGKSKSLLGTMDEDTAADLFSSCYPLHPLSALLLPLLCQKVAQNERTLFSYLGSREPHGFQDSVSRCAKVGDWIYPWEIYEYFILNQSAALSDHFTHRRWAEVVTAIERLGDVDPDVVHVLKTVGLLNIVGAQGNFKASKEIVGVCLPSKAVIERAIKELTQKSIIQYRKFSSEYRVWQGSDFDIDVTIQSEIEKLSRFSLAECLNRRHSLLPIVARKYSIQNGALRYFQPLFVDSQTLNLLHLKEIEARIIFFLVESKDDEAVFSSTVLDGKATLDIRVMCLNSDQLRESTAEVLALEEIQKTAQELNSDPIAQREFKDRYSAAAAKEDELLDRLTSEPQLNRWYWKKKLLAVGSKRSLQEELSRVLGVIYKKSPVFKNELINRSKPSSQANAAKNKLAIAMFNNEAVADLGIDKFPPEKAIYRACLRKPNLHVLDDNGNWHFRGPVSPSRRDDPCNIYPVWERIDAFLDGTEQQAKSLVELNTELLAPPYGIKEGVLPILYLAVLIANQQELAIHEGHVYTPYLSEEQIERFLKRPDEFTVQRFRITGLNQSIHDVYSTTLFNDGKQRSVLALARPIAKMIAKLPPYTQQTQTGLSSKAKAVRSAFKLSKSPIKLMLEELPRALDIDLRKAKHDEDELKNLSKRLMDVLKELQYCLSNLKDEFRVMLAQAFSQDKDIALVDLREAVAGRCRGLEDYTIDREGLKAFIQRALNTNNDPDQWLAALLGFLGQKPAEKWSDAEKGVAEYRLIELTRKLTELERLRLHYQDYASNGEGHFEVYLLRSVRKGAQDCDEVVAIDKHRHDAIQTIKETVLGTLNDTDTEFRIAVLAEIVDEILRERNEATSVKTSNSNHTMRRAK